MNIKNLLIFIFIFSSTKCNIRIIQHYTQVLKDSLAGYHIQDIENSNEFAQFQVYMDSMIKEQLALVQIFYSHQGNQEYIKLKVTNSVANDFEKEIFYNKKLLNTQVEIYKQFFQMIFTSPDKHVYMLNLEDILEFLLEDVEIQSFQQQIKLKVEDNNDVILKFQYDETTVLGMKISQSFEDMQNNTKKISYKISNRYSQQNQILNRDFELEALSNRRRIGLNFRIADLLFTRNYINNCEELLEEIKKSFPAHYKVENVDLNQIQYDFRLGAISKFFKIQTYNGSFIFSATYFEDDDVIGKYEMRIYKIDDFTEDNFKLYTKDNIKTIQFYRLTKNLMQKLINSLNFEKLLNVLSYEITQLYIQSHKQVFGQQFDYGDNSHGIIKHDETQGLFGGTKLTQRTVFTFDKQKNILFEFGYTEKKGEVNVEIINNEIEDEYSLNFDVKYYNKELVKNYFISCLHISQQIEHGHQFNIFQFIQVFSI